MLSTSQFPSTPDSHKFPISQDVPRHPECPAPTAVFPRMHITTILRGSLYFLKHCSFSYTMLHRCDCTAPEKGNSCSSTFSHELLLPLSKNEVHLLQSHKTKSENNTPTQPQCLHWACRGNVQQRQHHPIAALISAELRLPELAPETRNCKNLQNSPYPVHI